MIVIDRDRVIVADWTENMGAFVLLTECIIKIKHAKIKFSKYVKYL